MKKLIAYLSIPVLLLCAVALAEKGGQGKTHGWPNKGITSPGEPNHYASPGKWDHP